MKILITRPRVQADDFAERLHAVGFEPVYFPVIEIRPIEDNVALEKALQKLNCYEWVVFTSVNAVEIVFDVIARSEATKQSSVGTHKSFHFISTDITTKFAAIGPKTADALKARGVTPHFVPEEYVAEAILPGLGDLRGKWVLLPRAEIAREALPQAIFHAGGIPHEISVYKTIPAQPDLDGLAALKSGVDVVTLTSPSIVRNFVALCRQYGLDPLNLPKDPRFACIGPITEQAAREEGFTNLVMAKEYTTEGLTEVISQLEEL